MTNDKQLETLIEAFSTAGIDGSSWHIALDALARATGSRSGQLIGLGARASMPFNIMTNIDPAIERLFVDSGGPDPQLNPRVRVGTAAPTLKVLAESDFITPEEHARHPHYREFAHPADIPFICLTPLERQEELLVGMAVLRSKSEGHITAEQRKIFAAIAPHARAAVRTRLALEGQGAALVAGAMEAISLAVFVCDSTGTVKSLTSAAEELISSGRGLQLRASRLTATNASEAAALEEAIIAAAKGGIRSTAVHRAIVVHDTAQNGAPLVLDVVALSPRQCNFNFTPRVLVIASGERSADKRRAAVVQAAFGLTSAETDIALQLSAGHSPEVIAEGRCVAVGTVRAQIKSIFAKVGTSRQIELVARLNRI